MGGGSFNYNLQLVRQFWVIELLISLVDLETLKLCASLTTCFNKGKFLLFQIPNQKNLSDNVWSWGDGDYGKLGRGGSDGCKVPMKIESLAGLGVIKVECGSQFSVALTISGSVYTWGKGDYHRLGHGNSEYIRRPKKVAAYF